MTADQILERCRELVGQPLGAVAQRWKEQHPDVLLTYIEATDSTAHLFGHLRHPEWPASFD